jgi:UPF0271 protein
MRHKIDLNCDMGEGIGNESELIEYISTASIACGGHAGDAVSMEECIRLAQIYRKKLGPHPSYPDQANFGRVSMKLSNQAFKDALRDQLSQFFGIAEQLNAKVSHIKPHGALYNDMYSNVDLCIAFVELVEEFQKDLHIFCQPGSQLGKIAPLYGFEIKYEGFADRRYQQDGSLTSRKESYALITEVEDLCKQVFDIAVNKEVETFDGIKIPMHVQTLCLHGDSPNALIFASSLNRFLKENNIDLA